jgi:hypothetical protein
MNNGDSTEAALLVPGIRMATVYVTTASVYKASCILDILESLVSDLRFAKFLNIKSIFR